MLKQVPRLDDSTHVVPLESRAANAFVLAFDNTNGTATGVAINSVSTQTVSIPVVVRDDTGAQIGTDNISLSANGHYAFTLVVDKYPATAGIRGTIEFGTPSGGRIGVLGIRIPPAHTLTTLPAFAKYPAPPVSSFVRAPSAPPAQQHFTTPR